MNDKQRDFLIKEIDRNYNEQDEALRKLEPRKPSLNNYLVASILDNSIEYADISGLKEKIRTLVLKMGHGDVIVKEADSDDWYSSKNRKSKKDVHFVELIAEDLFILPQAYTIALYQYKKEYAEWEEKCKNLQAVRKTLETKVRLGSNEVLGRLIEQADNLVDLSLVNAQLVMLPPSKK